MALNLVGIQDALVDHALASGYFAAINRHEPKNSPTSGDLTAAVWVQGLGPVPRASGLAATTTRVELTLRIYVGMLTEPQDMIDTSVVAAVDHLVGAYSGDFTLGGQVREVDCLGAYGAPLAARAGYINIGGPLYRVMDITVPVVVNDLYDQAP